MIRSIFLSNLIFRCGIPYREINMQNLHYFQTPEMNFLMKVIAEISAEYCIDRFDVLLGNFEGFQIM